MTCRQAYRQLASSDFATLLPFYETAQRQFPLIRAVLESSQPGTVYVIETDNRQSAFVANRFGFAQFFGDVESAAGVDGLFEALACEAALKNRYLLWYDPPQGCRRRMDELPDDVARARTRILFAFNAGQFNCVKPAIQSAAVGVEVVALDEQQLDEADIFGLDIASRFWPSRDAFLKHGVGAAARVDNRLVSLCYAACVAGGVAEIDVATRDGYQGRGLARIVTAAFIDICLAQNIEPNWDCFDYNAASFKLAASLGFEEAARYPFYTINT